MITYTNLISLPILLYLLRIFLALQLCKGSQCLLVIFTMLFLFGVVQTGKEYTDFFEIPFLCISVY